MHSYARKTLENHIEVLDGLLNPENPPTTSSVTGGDRRPGKKAKKQPSEGNDEQTVSNAALMTVMERIEKMQEESLRRLQSLESTVKDNTQTIKSVTDSLEFLGKQVEDVTLHVDSLQSQVESFAQSTLSEMLPPLSCTSMMWAFF